MTTAKTDKQFTKRQTFVIRIQSKLEEVDKAMISKSIVKQRVVGLVSGRNYSFLRNAHLHRTRTETKSTGGGDDLLRGHQSLRSSVGFVRGSKRFLSNNATAKSDESDEPIFKTKTKIKLGLFAASGLLLYLYNKLNKDPIFREALKGKVPGAFEAISNVVSLDDVKLEEIKPPTVWDDEEVRGQGLSYEIPKQIVSVTTKKGLEPYAVLAGPLDTAKTLRGSLLKLGMSIDDEVVDIAVPDATASKSKKNVINAAENNHVDSKQLTKKGTLRDTLDELRSEEREIRAQIVNFNKLEGGSTKLLMLNAKLSQIQTKKKKVKSELKLL